MFQRLRPTATLRALSRAASSSTKLAVGSKLPATTLVEARFVEGGSGPIDLAAATKGKTVAIFGLPGAFTPACSEKHFPAYVENHAAFLSAGVDEIWCIVVNDPFVLSAWGRAQKAEGKVRLISDGDAVWTKANDLVFDLTGKSMGLRSTRYSLLVKDGVITHSNIDAPGKFDVSDAATLLAQINKH
ncbi:hypothetical protein ACHHYP_07993 [Achlya hypogyna]|uniref:Thioredoxin domain-containing protein n=1 Tax=Achlya hypogyna TaxID=1202772 RepID=A0A1V9YQ24_ACHHY|nr:hypothetical protein ACHHYP_07993 [Achlya hypogyna]